MTQQFVDSIKKPVSTFTWNGALSNPSPDLTTNKAGRLSLFFKTVRKVDDNQLEKYFEQAYSENYIDAYLIAFHVRDCRGGKGEREIGRKLLRMLADKDTNLFKKVISEIPEYGRWDDLVAILDKKDAVSSNRELSTAIFSVLSERLNRDYYSMVNSGECSLLAKWLPTEGGKLDTRHKFVAQFCKHMNCTPKSYRKRISLLRDYLKIIEKYMCTKEWKKIDYSTVPSCAMHKFKKAFLRNDSERYNNWLEKLKNNDTTVKVNAKQLFPHEIVKEICKNNSSDYTLLRAQWDVIYKETKKLGTFDNVLVISDVSGSMVGTPMDVSIALGILLSSCAEGPFNKKVMTFHSSPKFISLDSDDIVDNVNTLKNSPWGGNTDFQAVFNLILKTGRANNLKDKDMPKTIYILSDMQFDQAMPGNYSTNYETVKKNYSRFEYTVPKIVFWNLNGSSKDFPATVDDNGTCMISGFSTSILKSILKFGIMDSFETLRNTIDDERYLKIRELVQ